MLSRSGGDTNLIRRCVLRQMRLLPLVLKLVGRVLGQEGRFRGHGDHVLIGEEVLPKLAIR